MCVKSEKTKGKAKERARKRGSDWLIDTLTREEEEEEEVVVVVVGGGGGEYPFICWEKITINSLFLCFFLLLFDNFLIPSSQPEK